MNFSKSFPMLQNRVTQMEQTLAQVDKEVERDQAIVDLLSKADDETKVKYEINDFINTINQQIQSYQDQKEKFRNMIASTKKAIEIYESNPKQYAELMENILVSFGFDLDNNFHE